MLLLWHASEACAALHGQMLAWLPVILVCQHTLAAFYGKIARRSNSYALSASRDFYGHYQARSGHCAPRLSPYGDCTYLLSVLYSLAQARSSHHCTLTASDAGHGRLRASIPRQMVFKRLLN